MFDLPIMWFTLALQHSHLVGSRLCSTARGEGRGGEGGEGVCEETEMPPDTTALRKQSEMESDIYSLLERYIVQ